jgi:hypothetical protein
MATTYFGYCDSSGNGTGNTAIGAYKDIDYAADGFICPGTGQQDITALEIDCYSSPGSGQKTLLGVYSGTTLVVEGSTTVDPPNPRAWTGYASVGLTWRNGYTYLTGGETYLLVVSNKYDGAGTLYGTTGLASGTWKYKVADYTGGLPDPLPTGFSDYTINVNIRCGVEPSTSSPTVTTTAITSILGTSATSGGTVTDAGGADVTAQGVCWSTSANPTTTDSKTDDIADPSPFASSITGLTANTVYHVRAYATNSAGTGYGADVQFETDVVPTVTTTAISLLLHTTATSGGNVTADGGSTITARGVCWNTSTLPTTANSKTTDAGTTGSYTSLITGLTKATTYHVRSYATNSVGTTYGTEVDFTTDTLSDISDAVFTVTEATTPVVSSLSDSTVYAGETITITGTDFGSVEGYVRFVWNYAAITSWAATSIVVTVPPSVVAGNLYVGLPTEVWSEGTAYTLGEQPTAGGGTTLGIGMGL